MNKKNIISLLVLAILAVAIPLGLNLARQQQTLKSSATEAPILFSGDNAEQRNGAWVVKDRTKPVTVTFTSPLGPPGVGVGSTGPHILRSVQSPVKKKVSFSLPSLVKEVYAGHDCINGPFYRYCDGNWIYEDQGPNPDAGNACHHQPITNCAASGQICQNAVCVNSPTPTSQPPARCDDPGVCSSWTPGACGAGSCSTRQKQLTRTCTRTGCELSRCYDAPECPGTVGGGTACNRDAVSMSVSPNPANVGDNITFNISGSQGSTWIGDIWIGGGVDCSGSFWGSKTCRATSAGDFTWKHTWHTTSSESPTCDKDIRFTIRSSQTTPTPTPTTAPVAKECDFNGNNEYDDGDIINFWKDIFLHGGTPADEAKANCKNDSKIDLLDFNKWRNLRWHGSEGS